MKVGLVGTANATLAGKAEKLTAIVRGISTLTRLRLQAKDAAVGAEGAATIDANVTNSRQDRRDRAGDDPLHRPPVLHAQGHRLGDRHRVQIV